MLKTLLILFLTALLASCNKDASNGFGGLDSSDGQGTVACKISSSSPIEKSVKVAATSGTKNVFNIVPSTSTCKVYFFINGVKKNSISSTFIDLDASDLALGENIIRVEADNTLGSDFLEWTVTKNLVPTCVRAVPTIAAINMINTGSQAFTVNATADAGETLSFRWLLNGSDNSALAETITGATASQALLSADPSLNGFKTISAEVSDGYDSVTCSWTANIGDDCSIAAKSPDVPNVRLAASGASSNYSVTTTTSTCLVAWTLNGIDLAGTSPSRTVTSADINVGSNVLKAEVSSTSGVTSRTWTLVKNTPPTCAQIPSSSSGQTSAGTPLNLSATFSDVNNDTISWLWFFNGAAVTGPPVIVTNATNATSAIFTPALGNIGYNAFSLALSDGYDTANCSWNVQVNPTCGISSKTPSAASITVPHAPSTVNNFSIIPTDASCSISWSLNGINLGTNLPSVNFYSSLLGSSNTLIATVSNSSSSSSQTWNMTKNSPPSCGSQLPLSSGHIMGVSSSQVFTANFVDSDSSQSLTYDWKHNGMPTNSSYFTISNSSSSTSGTWTSTSGQIGAHNLSVTVSDSYDTAFCNWPVEILRSCSASSSSPSGSSLRVSNLGTTLSNFGAVANDSSCNIIWKLNGTILSEDVSGQNFQKVLSSSLSSTNTIEAIMSNAVSTATRAWAVAKNSPPVCDQQLPSSATSLIVNTGSSEVLNLTATDSDSDNLTYLWKLNGSTSSSLQSIISSGYNSSVTFLPLLGQVGDDQIITSTMSDSYDTAACSWNIDVRDPNTAQIISYTPVTTETNRAVILSYGNQQFTITATGTGLTYKWKLDGVEIAGMNSSNTSFDFNDMTVGVHIVLVEVSDTYGNTVSKPFYVKRNAPPTISSFSPNVNGVNTYKLGYNQNFNFSTTAGDLNGDTLTYRWLLDNSTSSYIAGTSSSATLSPNGNTLLLGPHTIKAVISDGHEETTATWLVAINYFSDECNALYNLSPSSSSGKVCTLVGNPSMGHKDNIQDDQTLFKAKPSNMIEIESGVYAMSDHTNHTVIIYNSTPTSFSGVGKIIGPGTMQVVLGNGAPGRNSDASSETDSFQNVGSGGDAVAVPIFKLNEPRGLAWDSANNILYVADRNNHRVLALNSNGKVRRVLGESGGNASNVLASNTDNTDGSSHSCSEPMGVSTSGNYLYTTCYSQHVIKRTTINDPSDSNNYKKTFTIVGRHHTNGANYNSVGTNINDWQRALPDGFPGLDRDSLTGATSYTNFPFHITSDANGVVYWSERLSWGHGLRIRAYNPTLTNFDWTPIIDSNLTSAAGLYFRALDLTGGINSYIPNAPSQAVNVTTGSLTGGNFLVGSHARFVTNGCHAVSVTMRNSSNTPISLGINTIVTMSANGSVFYSDAGCTAALASNQLTIDAGQTHKTIFIRPTVGTYFINATSGVVTSNSASVVVASVGATGDRIRTFASQRFKFDECLPVEIQILNSSLIPAAKATGQVLALDTNNFGQYYADSICAGPIQYRVQFSSSEFNKVMYYKRQIYLPAGMITSVAGYDGSNANIYNDYSNNVKIGELRLHGLMGFDVLSNSITGIPDAIGWGSEYHSLNYLNLKPTVDVFGGRNFTTKTSNVLLGVPNNLLFPVSIGGGIYNGDDQPSWGTSTNQVNSVKFSLDKSMLIFTDYNNKRVRFSDLDSGNMAGTLAGAGRDRWRQNVTSINSQNVSLYNPYKIEYTNGYLYFSEVSNHWIRRVSTNTGIVENVAGNGYATSYTEANDATTEGMRSPKGFKVIPYPNSISPTNYVLFYAEQCIVRAVNLSGPSITNFYGVGTLLPGKVKTVAGDYTYACVSWPSSGNTDGMAATSARLRDPEDIAVIGTDLYIMQYSDNCMVKVDTNGIITRPQGASSCGTISTSNDSTMDSMRMRYPRAFAPDASNPGNYFFVDQYTDTTGFIRYINSLTSIVRFKDSTQITVNAKANLSAPLVVKTIYNQPATSGQSNIGGVASWSASTTSSGPNDKVCWSAGALANGLSGSHAIYCANRNQDDEGLLIAGPSGASGIRAGAPLGREQEKVGRLNATFFSPYGLTFDEDGNLYITEYDNHVIRMIRRWW